MADNSKAAGSDGKLGLSVRALRRRNNWSLAIASAKTGLAASTLSRIENNQLSLTYEKLLQLCRGLGVELSELLANGDSPVDVSRGRRTHTPPEAGRMVEAGSYLYRYLCTDLRGKKMTPIIGVITASSIEAAGGYLRHEGEEVVYVLEGQLELHTEFYEPLRVETGGCVYFDSTMGHAFVAVDGQAKILSVCTSEETSLVAAATRRHAGQGEIPAAPRRVGRVDPVD